MSYESILNVYINPYGNVIFGITDYGDKVIRLHSPNDHEILQILELYMDKWMPDEGMEFTLRGLCECFIKYPILHQVWSDVNMLLDKYNEIKDIQIKEKVINCLIFSYHLEKFKCVTKDEFTLTLDIPALMIPKFKLIDILDIPFKKIDMLDNEFPITFFEFVKLLLSQLISLGYADMEDMYAY